MSQPTDERSIRYEAEIAEQARRDKAQAKAKAIKELNDRNIAKGKAAVADKKAEKKSAEDWVRNMPEKIINNPPQ